MNKYYANCVYRLVSGAFGLFLGCIGIYGIFLGVPDLLLRAPVGFIFALLGINMLWSAMVSRECWLVKLGALF